MLERRSHTRHQLQLPITVGAEAGLTRDVSSGGVYFHLPHAILAGSLVEFTLRVPKLAEAGFELRCTARVIRVDAGAAANGIAAHIEQLEMQPMSASPSLRR